MSDDLPDIQRRLRTILHQRGYEQVDDELALGRKIQGTMEFVYLNVPEPDRSWWERQVQRFSQQNSDQRGPIDPDDFSEGIANLIDEVPFRITFRFHHVTNGEEEGIDIEVESLPALLQKYQQGDLPADYDYNKKTVVEENKRYIKSVFSKIGFRPYVGPEARAETLETELHRDYRTFLQDIEYGPTVLHYLDQGDECLKNGQLHAAFSCYIHVIEWTIIAYLIEEQDRDLIQIEKENKEKEFYFGQLVDEVRTEPGVNQKTLETLDQWAGTERHWMGHHKSGEIKARKVEEVRDVTFNLIGQLFDDKVQLATTEA